ncbi:hypothetical protein JL722_4085 [Aureococcus anophagefferens]|nr:hypothetical protein JL722_4085 [Aureococcus anophagefferens]
MPPSVAWLGHADPDVDVPSDRVVRCSTLPFARENDEASKVKCRNAARDYKAELTTKACAVAGERRSDLIFSGTSGSGADGRALLLRYAREESAGAPAARGGGAARNLKFGARRRASAAAGEFAAPAALAVAASPVGATHQRADAPDAGERPAKRLAAGFSGAGRCQVARRCPWAARRGGVRRGARRLRADAATAGEPVRKKPCAALVDGGRGRRRAPRDLRVERAAARRRVPGDDGAAPAPAEARATAFSSRAGEPLCLTGMRLGLHRPHVSGRERTDYSFRKDAVAAGYALHEKDGPLQTDSEAFFWKDGLVRAAGGAEEPSPADRARVNGVVFDAAREHLVPDFHTVTILGRMGREAFDKDVLARDDVRSADVSAVFRAAANVLLAAAGEKPRKTPSYWEAQLVFTPKGDVLVLAGHHPCAKSPESLINRWLFAELEAVAFRGLRDHIVPLAASPLMWSASFSSGAVYTPTAVFDDPAYSDWTEPRGDENDARVGRAGAASRVERSKRIVDRAEAGAEPAARALLSAARFFAAASGPTRSPRAFLRARLRRRQIQCPLLTLAEFGYDLGGRPAAEALESSLAAAADAGEELEPRLVGALKQLAGNAKGGSWSPLLTLAEFGYDLGGRPASEALESSLAAAADAGEELEPRLVGALKQLAGSEKGGSRAAADAGEELEPRLVGALKQLAGSEKGSSWSPLLTLAEFGYDLGGRQRPRRRVEPRRAAGELEPRLVGALKQLAGSEKGGSWSPLLTLEEYSYDLGGRPASEALESSLADAADGDGVAPEPRLVRALKQLAGNAKGGSKGVTLADREAREKVFVKELEEASDWTCIKPEASAAKFRASLVHNGDRYQGGSFTRARDAAELVDALKLALGAEPCNFPREHVIAEGLVEEAQAIIAKVQKDKAKPAEAEVVTPEKKCARCNGLFCVMREEKLWTWHRIGRTSKWGWGSKCDRCVKESQKTNGATGKAGNAKAPAKKPTVSKAKAKKKPAAKKKAPAKKEPAPAPAEAVVTVSARGRVRKKRDLDA